MRPHDDLRGDAGTRGQMLIESSQRLEHVGVAQVPGVRAAAEHAAVILLRVLHDHRVLTDEERGVVCGCIVLLDVIQGSAHIHELIDHRLLAGLGPERGIGIVGGVVSEAIETVVPVARAGRSFGIDASR